MCMRAAKLLSVSVVAMVFGAPAWANDAVTQTESSAGVELTALDRYVRTTDPEYRYDLLKTIDGDGYTGYILHMVSQRWMTDTEVDRSLWEHHLEIVRPDTVTSDIGMLFIGGRDNDDAAPENVGERMITLSKATGTVTATLYQVPNQPLTFPEDGRARKEDAIIAYTWDKFMRTGDERWPLRLPMTKAAVRAMDTMTSFCASGEGGYVEVDKFVVSGGSKRGWTTWTTAAVDNRVIAIAPIVIDLLNIVPSFIHHFEVYGKYAPAVGDYMRENIMAWTGSPEYASLMRIEEPFEYRKRLTMPKYIINATQDQFFIPDSSQFYWDELIGEKYLRYVPNAEHGLDGSDVSDSLLSWYHSIVNNVPRPRYTWDVQSDGSIRVLTMEEPIEVRLWQATNPEIRNFQTAAAGENIYTSTVLPALDRGVYVGKITPPAAGWTAYFVELTYKSEIAAPFKFTTEVKVWPEEKPFKFEYPTAADHAPGFLSN